MKPNHKCDPARMALLYIRQQFICTTFKFDAYVETATRLYGDRYQFVVCTHLDKDHLHNHIVLNPISIVDGKRYHNSMKDIYQLREVSDEICKEYGLSIVEKPQGKGQSRSHYYSARSYIREIKKA